MKFFRVVLFLLACTSPAFVTARAQLTSPLGATSTSPALMAQKTQPPPTTSDALTFETRIDPSEYHLGPGDIFECRFWTSGETFYPVVSADDQLFVPNLGAFDVRSWTLAELDSALSQKIAVSFASKKFDASNPPVSLSLYAPKKIYITVRGDVETPGAYMLSGAIRGDVAVELANKIDPTLRAQQEPKTENDRALELNGEKRLQAIFGTRGAIPASERYITVTHDDGTSDRIDLIRFRALHDMKSAPPLRQGDVINVPFRDRNAGSLGVYGAVQSPGDFEFVPGDSLLAAIQYAFGPTPDADLHHVELTRIGSDGVVDPPTVFDLTQIENHSAPNVPLMPNDRIIVRSMPEAHLTAVVDVRGEVVMPGPYPITDGKTTLSELIQMAGGLTPQAYPAAGTIDRHGYDERITAGSPEEISAMRRLLDLGVSDTGNFSLQMKLRPTTVNVNMEKVVVDHDRSEDIPLQDGDVITIPKKPTTVYVGGFVNYGGYVNYQENAPLNYYIAQAGGYANGAEKSETSVIKLRTKAWMDPGDTKIEPGDEIYVPKEPDHSEQYSLAMLAAIAAIAGAVFAAASLYVTIRRP